MHSQIFHNIIMIITNSNSPNAYTCMHACMHVSVSETEFANCAHHCPLWMDNRKKKKICRNQFRYSIRKFYQICELYIIIETMNESGKDRDRDGEMETCSCSWELILQAASCFLGYFSLLHCIQYCYCFGTFVQQQCLAIQPTHNDHFPPFYSI